MGLLAAVLLVLAAAPAPAVDSDVRFVRAVQAYAAGKYEEALAEYDAILKLSGEDSAARNNRALCYLAMAQLDKARWEADRAIELAPTEGRYYVTLGVIQIRVKPPDLKGARASLLLAVKYLKKVRDNEGLGNACYNLGVIAQRRLKYQEARNWYKDALDYDPSNNDAREALNALDPGRGG